MPDSGCRNDTEHEDIRHRGGSPCKLRLTALQQDVLFHHIEETIQDADGAAQFVLGDILDQLPEEDILSRPPSVETLVEIGYFENGLTDDFDAAVVETGGGR